MGEAVVALARVGGYTRTTKTGKLQNVHAYDRHDRKKIIGALELLASSLHDLSGPKLERTLTSALGRPLESHDLDIVDQWNKDKADGNHDGWNPILKAIGPVLNAEANLALHTFKKADRIPGPGSDSYKHTYIQPGVLAQLRSQVAQGESAVERLRQKNNPYLRGVRTKPASAAFA